MRWAVEHGVFFLGGAQYYRKKSDSLTLSFLNIKMTKKKRIFNNKKVQKNKFRDLNSLYFHIPG